MRLDLFKSFRILPGLRLNFGTRGLSMHLGPRGTGVQIGKGGVRPIIRVPGTNFSYSPRLPQRNRPVRTRRHF